MRAASSCGRRRKETPKWRAWPDDIRLAASPSLTLVMAATELPSSLRHPPQARISCARLRTFALATSSAVGKPRPRGVMRKTWRSLLAQIDLTTPVCGRISNAAVMRQDARAIRMHMCKTHHEPDICFHRYSMSRHRLKSPAPPRACDAAERRHTDRTCLLATTPPSECWPATPAILLSKVKECGAPTEQRADMNLPTQEIPAHNKLSARRRMVM